MKQFLIVVGIICLGIISIGFMWLHSDAPGGGQEWYIRYQTSRLEKGIFSALEKDDYPEAYELMAELKSVNIISYTNARNEVVKKECLFLVSQGDEQSARRIIYLLGQYYLPRNTDDMKDKQELEKILYVLAKKVKNEYVITFLDEDIPYDLKYQYEESSE